VDIDEISTEQIDDLEKLNLLVSILAFVLSALLAFLGIIFAKKIFWGVVAKNRC
jgi:hypothetical protein